MKLAKYVFCLTLLLFIALPAVSRAADPTTVNVSSTPTPSGAVDFSGLRPGLPGMSGSSNPAQLVADIYNFALMIAGLLAFGSILYGGIMYLTTGGNTSAQAEAKGRIKDAVIGLLLLIGIYFVLNLINPDLTKLKFPTLTPVPPPQTSTTFTVNPNAVVAACVPHGYRTDQVEADPSKIKQCYPDVGTCANDTTNCPNAGSGLWDCVQVKGSYCSAVNTTQTTSNCIWHGQSLPALPTLAGDAAAMLTNPVQRASSDPNIERNLQALNDAVNKFQQLLQARGDNLTINSMYRPFDYQNYLYTIFTDHNALADFNAITPAACLTLKTQVDQETINHGIQGQVAKPSACAPHVAGLAVDLSFKGISIQDAANLLSASNINLYWRALPGDAVHFQLKNPPYQPSC